MKGKKLAVITIQINDTGNDTISFGCSSDKVTNFLNGKVSPLDKSIEVTGAEQLTIVMCRAAYQFLEKQTKSKLR